MSVSSGREPIDAETRRHQAYLRGYMEHEHALTDTGLTADDIDFSELTDSSIWRNSTLPDMRALAGYVDDGYGDYAGLEGDVRVIVDGVEEVQSRKEFAPQLLDELVGEYLRGAADGSFAPFDADLPLDDISRGSAP